MYESRRVRSRRGLLRHRLTVSFGTPPQRGCFHGCPYAQCGDEVTRQPISHTDEVTEGRCERRNGRQVARLLASRAGTTAPNGVPKLIEGFIRVLVGGGGDDAWRTV